MMKNKKLILGFIILIAVVSSLIVFLLLKQEKSLPPLTIEQVKEKYESELMRIEGAVGVEVGECDGESCIKVHLEKEIPKSVLLPVEIEGFKVEYIGPTGSIEVLPNSEEKIIVKQSGGEGLLTEECADKSYITETADYIIEGFIEKVESKWDKERTSIFTYSDLRIEKYLKGTPFPIPKDKIQIVTPGGTVEGISQWSQWVEDQPIFHESKKVRIYFQQINGEFSIVCSHLGVEEIL